MATYSDAQMEALAEAMPAVMKALREIRERPAVPFSKDQLVHATRTIEKMQQIAGEVFDELDDWCWHDPQCGKSETCEGGKQSLAEAFDAAVEADRAKVAEQRDRDEALKLDHEQRDTRDR